MLTFDELKAKIVSVTEAAVHEAEDDMSNLFAGHAIPLVGALVLDARRIADALEHLAFGKAVNTAGIKPAEPFVQPDVPASVGEVAQPEAAPAPAAAVVTETVAAPVEADPFAA